MQWVRCVMSPGIPTESQSADTHASCVFHGIHPQPVCVSSAWDSHVNMRKMTCRYFEEAWKILDLLPGGCAT